MMSDVELLLIFSTIVILAVVLMLLFIYVYFLTQKTKLIIETKEKKLQFEQELAFSQIEMKEQTLDFVGQELHDDIGQKISVALLITSKYKNNNDSGAKQDMDEIRAILEECIRDIRNLSRTFRTNNVEHFGLVESLKLEVQRLERLDFVKVNLHYNNLDVDISRKDSLILFRIIQECLYNALEHSKAKNIDIELIDTARELLISVADNGLGITLEQASSGPSLRNMKNRAAIINASLIISGTADKGTEVKIKYNKS